MPRDGREREGGMTPFELITLAAAAWYVAYIVTSSDGPFHIFEKLRARAPMGGLTTCIICLSIWVAIVLRVIGANIVTDALAIAGVALWIHSYTGWRIDMGG